MQRSSVDLPQPEGPMKAVICFSGIFSEMLVQRLLLAVPERQGLDVEDRILDLRIQGGLESQP